mmetsp:Transcript_80545/g.260932  ORF Transcript_80545/g.260932 Transcript_80545/m.260932 type:complete len:239 (+) Transcript_80545:617-1333(+)
MQMLKGTDLPTCRDTLTNPKATLTSPPRSSGVPLSCRPRNSPSTLLGLGLIARPCRHQRSKARCTHHIENLDCGLRSLLLLGRPSARLPRHPRSRYPNGLWARPTTRGAAGARPGQQRRGELSAHQKDFQASALRCHRGRNWRGRRRAIRPWQHSTTSCWDLGQALGVAAHLGSIGCKFRRAGPLNARGGAGRHAPPSTSGAAVLCRLAIARPPTTAATSSCLRRCCRPLPHDYGAPS